MLAEGGTEYGHMETMQRSKNIYGPYEKCPHNPILSHRDTPGPIQATGHADIVEDQNGNWWLVCLAIRPIKNMQLHHIGRESFLAPLTWDKDGWPMVGNCGTIDFEMEGPLPGPKPTPVRCDFCDSFDSDKLNLKWTFLRNPRRENYILGNGRITLKGGNDGLSTHLGHPTMIALRQEEFDIEATASLEGEIKEEQMSGLCAFYNGDYHYDIFVTKEQDGHKVCLRKQVADICVIVESKKIDYKGNIKFKLVANDEWYKFLYEKDGEFIELGKGATSLLATEVNGRSFTGVFLGAFSEKGTIAVTNVTVKEL
jgi:alpha-N-arabinofuranosidase